MEKLKAKIVKEGGKKGVEIEGASDMGGLDFFCTTMELPEGNLEYLVMAMDAMNAEPDPEAEDRKGCSGHVGKMIFSAGVDQLAIVAYVRHLLGLLVQASCVAHARCVCIIAWHVLPTGLSIITLTSHRLTGTCPTASTTRV